MSLTYPLASIALDQMTKTNMAWYIRDNERPLGVAVSIMTNEMRRKEERDEQMAKMYCKDLS